MNYFKLLLALVASGLFATLALKPVSAGDKEKLRVDDSGSKSYCQPQARGVSVGNTSTQRVSSRDSKTALVDNKEVIKKQDKKKRVEAKENSASKPLAPKENLYDILIENIAHKLEFNIQDNRTLEKRVVKLNGEDLFKKIKSDFSYMLESEIAKEAFRNYFSHYYQKNKNLSKIYKDVKIDLMNFENFVKFSTLEEAFLSYKEQELAKDSF
ncbi:MAG: hypothetical protein A3F91_09115 [Flavobacteria bacterium RIFCSPLOWO2_12_FULL_35_11]|nr:MAG: hypothetical protein A3F91_09115 [Flavobacteria bacterium RIFCSPLOWO2_12_FULL_35_11]